MATTLFYGLYKPGYREELYHTLVNANFDTIDTKLHDLLTDAGNVSEYGGATRIYVSAAGSDANDGRSWATAKKTILAAYDAVGPNSLESAEIIIGSGVRCGGTVPGQGLWFAGPSDPQYAALPAGWRQLNGRVSFIGLGPYAMVYPGQEGDPAWTGPWISLSYVINDEVRFSNLREGATASGYGIDLTRFASGADHLDTYNCANVYFDNIWSFCSLAHATAGYNPFRSVGTFWLYLDEMHLFLESPVATTLVGAQAASTPGTVQSWTVATGAPTNWPAPPFTARIAWEDVRVTAVVGTTWTVTRGYNDTEPLAHSNGDGIHFDPRSSKRACLWLGSLNNNPNYLVRMKRIVNTFGTVMAEQTYECIFEDLAGEGCIGPTLHFVNPSWGNLVKSVDSYDQEYASDGVVEVRPINSSPSAVTIEGIGFAVGFYTPPLFGPALVLDGNKNAVSLQGNSLGERSYQAWGQQGWQGRKLWGQHDTARRAGLAIAHHPNLASQDETTWAAIADGASAVTTGQADVFGLTRAARLAGNGSTYRGIYSGAWNPSAPAAGESLYKGDFVFFGGWMRSNKGWDAEKLIGGHYAVELTVTAGATRFLAGAHVATTGDALAYIDHPHRGNLDWNFFQGFAKASVGGASTIKMRVYFDTYVCYPVLFTVAGITDAEAWEIYMHLATYPDQTPAGAVASPRGSKIIARGGMGVGNSAAATEVIGKAVVKKIEVFDESGASLGFVPVYAGIT